MFFTFCILCQTKENIFQFRYWYRKKNVQQKNQKQTKLQNAMSWWIATDKTTFNCGSAIYSQMTNITISWRKCFDKIREMTLNIIIREKFWKISWIIWNSSLLLELLLSLLNDWRFLKWKCSFFRFSRQSLSSQHWPFWLQFQWLL
jgi:hypothetical protein